MKSVILKNVFNLFPTLGLLLFLASCAEDSTLEEVSSARENTGLEMSASSTLGQSNATQARYYISAENTTFSSSGYMTEGGENHWYQGQGPYEFPKTTTHNPRKGQRCLKYAMGAADGSKKYRTEHSFFHAKHVTQPYAEPISPGDKRYFGFSFRLPNDFTTPTGQINLHQLKQRYADGVAKSRPIIQFGWFDTSEPKIQIQARFGRDGDHTTKVGPLPILDPDRGSWYDVVLGWKFAPNDTNGWYKCWIKKKNDTSYGTPFVLNNTKIGYRDHPMSLENSKFGLYANGAPGKTVFFDELRWGTTFDSVKIP